MPYDVSLVQSYYRFRLRKHDVILFTFKHSLDLYKKQYIVIRAKDLSSIVSSPE